MSEPSIKHIPSCLQKAIVSTFEVQLGMKVKVDLSLTVQNLKTNATDCMSNIALKSSGLVGSLSLGFPTKTFLQLVEKMLGETYSEITPENSDASGELLNIIYASARKNINEGGFDFEPALPTTVIGKELLLSRSNLTGKVLYFDCVSEVGPFGVTLSLKTK